ncbi:hypothetical protein PTKIN_Ptkin10aG0112800 [Pterospermum kingtungense]
MCSKKRSNNCEVEVVEGQHDLATDNTVLMPSNKKIKIGNKIDANVGDGVPCSIKPTERKKKRKQIDNERRHLVLEEEEPQSKQMNVESKEMVPGNMWHLHRLSCRKCRRHVIDLGIMASAGSSSRECARQGFALGLTALVATIPSIKVDSLLKLMVNLLEIWSSMKGQLPSEALLDHILEASGIPQWFQEAIDVGNPDALLLALKICEKMSIDSTSSANFCQESTFCQSRVHSLWPILVNILLPDTILQAEDAASVSSSLKKHKKGRNYSSSEGKIARMFQ